MSSMYRKPIFFIHFKHNIRKYNNRVNYTYKNYASYLKLDIFSDKATEL